MELRIELNYNQLVKLIRQLPQKEIKLLITILQSEIESGKSSQSLQKMILDAPTWTDAEFNDYKKAKAHMNLFKSHARRQRITL